MRLATTLLVGLLSVGCSGNFIVGGVIQNPADTAKMMEEKEETRPARVDQVYVQQLVCSGDVNGAIYYLAQKNLDRYEVDGRLSAAHASCPAGGLE